MEIGMIGLGRMGANMVRRLMQGGHRCVVFDHSADAVKALVGEKVIGAASLPEFAGKLRIFHYAVSLGHHKSLIFYLPTEDLAAKTFQLTGAARQRYEEDAGDGIFRVSVGLESADDLCADLDESLR